MVRAEDMSDLPLSLSYRYGVDYGRHLADALVMELIDEATAEMIISWCIVSANQTTVDNHPLLPIPVNYYTGVLDGFKSYLMKC